MKVRTILAVGALILSAFGAFAEDAKSALSPEAAKRMEACKDDAQKFCAAEVAAREKGGEKGIVGKCLDGHTAELSAGCKTARAEKK